MRVLVSQGHAGARVTPGLRPVLRFPAGHWIRPQCPPFLLLIPACPSSVHVHHCHFWGCALLRKSSPAYSHKRSNSDNADPITANPNSFKVVALAKNKLFRGRSPFEVSYTHKCMPGPIHRDHGAHLPSCALNLMYGFPKI